MEKSAPFADTAILINIGSVTGLKYTTKCCLECGAPLVERNGDKLFRITNKYPEEARINESGVIPTVCHKCSQAYTFTVSTVVNNPTTGISLWLQPQTIFLAITGNKKLRDTHCFECGYTFFSVSDRYGSLSDNTIPFDLLDPEKLGPVEPRCKYQHCKQRWSIMA
jgi:hypothetical protein